MRFTELEPQFIRYGTRRVTSRFVKPGIDPLRGNWTEDDFEEREVDRAFWTNVDHIQDAQGVRFLCPRCYRDKGGPVGVHQVVCWSKSRGVPDSASPGPGRWSLAGSGYDDLTLEGDGGSRSVLLQGGCNWHGFVTNGEVTDA